MAMVAMVATAIAIILAINCAPTTARKVPVYFLHAEFDLQNPVNGDAPDRDCVHTVGGPKPLPPQVTICQRTMHYTYMKPKSSYAFGFGFGTVLPKSFDQDWSGIEQGWIYGEWETGPWWGFRTKEKEAGKYGWVGLGEGMRSDHMVWRHTCSIIDFKAGRIALFENGKKYFDKTDMKDVQDTYATNSKQIDIVTAGCTYRGSNSLSVHGKVTDFQMWGRVLPDEELVKVTGCTAFPEGDLVSWEGDSWFLNSSRNTAREESADLEKDVCRSTSSSLHLVPVPSKMETALHTCARLSGQVARYSSKQKFESIVGFLSSRQHQKVSPCLEEVAEPAGWNLRVWTANTDEEMEGVWKDRYSGEEVDFAPWPPDRPWNGGFAYNCMMLEVLLERTVSDKSARIYYGSGASQASIADEECSLEYCDLCEVTSPTRKMHIRGLCSLSLFDRDYTYLIGKDGRPMYLGYRSSVIFYDRDASAWVWYDRKDNRSVAVSSSPEASLFLGVHTVDFAGVKDDKCHSGPVEASMLKQVKMTSCSKGEFSCNDGQCISMEERCDQTANCLDKSDEENCRMVNMEGNYNKKVAPFSYDKVAKQTSPVGINVSMSVMDVLKIEEVNHVYTLKFRLLLEWHDYRLQYYNLKKSRSQNALALDEIYKLWIPFLVFTNTENNEATMGTEDTEVTITREGDLEPAGDDSVDEIDVFDGRHNRIAFEQIYTKTFKCTYQLQMYPFDTQICSVLLKVRKLETAAMVLSPKTVDMESETMLTQYIIRKWKLDFVNPENHDDGVELVLVLRRRLMSAILTIYFPTILILTIVYATNFFKDFFFEAVVTVNLTALLVLVTLFISVSQSLPQTAYVKMVDVWLIFAQVVPFVEVLVHTWIDMLRTEGEEGREVNHHGKTITVGGDQDTMVEDLDSENLKKKLFTDRKSADLLDKKQDAEAAGIVSKWKKNANMVQVDEKKMVKARKDFYDNAVSKHETMVKRLKFVTLYVIPVFILVFSFLYWSYGLLHYYQ